MNGLPRRKPAFLESLPLHTVGIYYNSKSSLSLILANSFEKLKPSKLECRVKIDQLK